MTPTRDELLERYADAAAQDPRRPSDRVRDAARAHAQMLRDQAATAYRLESAKPAKQKTVNRQNKFYGRIGTTWHPLGVLRVLGAKAVP